MKNNRRNFLKLSGLTGIGISTGAILPTLGEQALPETAVNAFVPEADQSIIGQYGKWAASLNEKRIPSDSFRANKWKDLETWKKEAKRKLEERLAIPDLGPVPKVTVHRRYSFDGLDIEELSWQLPYGQPTQALVLKPQNAQGPLPGILGFHDHGANKYFGKRKITRTGTDQHPLMRDHQDHYYDGAAWANEIAKKGYVVLVPDTFTFASRRVLLEHVPPRLRQGIDDKDPENSDNIAAYNSWAADHEHIMAKSLFSAGTTWPGVFFAEDQKALDVLCARPDVDADRIGCGGLSGGGLRTVFMGGLDPRIKCAVCVGFMSTWKDFVVNKSFTHTWMTYVPISPNELDFPEILGLRVPLPTLVLNDIDDALYTMPEMENADKILREVFDKAGAGEQYRCSFYPGPHKFDKKMQSEAFDWFDRWLKA
ncbi:MAG TPA: alpha/beta hydrolase family protein [Cyclobacteriaceae bacterium]|nr:alpha/beta hydrolase family protein [Cyclobacteriaceae bacterium]